MVFSKRLKLKDDAVPAIFRIIIRMSFIARYVYTYEEFVFVTEATAMQQNDSDRTKNTDNKNMKYKIIKKL